MEFKRRFISTFALSLSLGIVFSAAAARADFVLFDDFEGYPVGDVNQDFSSPWVPHQNTGLFTIVEEEGNQFLGYGWSSNTRGGSRPVPWEMQIAPGSRGTVFLQFRAGPLEADSSQSAHFGLGHNIALVHNPSDDMRVEVALRPGPSLDQHWLQVRDGTEWRTLTTVSRGFWYNLWIVVDRTDGDSFELFLNQTASPATEADRLSYSTGNGAVSSFAFRDGSVGETLDGFAAFAHIAHRTMVLDNIWIDPSQDNLDFRGRDFNDWQTDFAPVEAPFAIDFGTGAEQSDGSELIRPRAGSFTLESGGLRFRAIADSFTTSSAMASVSNYQHRQNFTLTTEFTLEQLLNVSAARVGLAVLGDPHVPGASPFNQDDDSSFYTVLWYPAVDGETSRLQVRSGFNGPILAAENWEGLHPSVENQGLGGIGSLYTMTAEGEYDRSGMLHLTLTLSDTNGFSQSLSALIPNPVEGDLFGFGGRLSNMADSNPINPEFTFRNLSLTLGDGPVEVVDPVVEWPFEFTFGTAEGHDGVGNLHLTPAGDWELQEDRLRLRAEGSAHRASLASTRVSDWTHPEAYGLNLRFEAGQLPPDGAQDRIGLMILGASDFDVFDVDDANTYYTIQLAPQEGSAGKLSVRRGSNGPLVSEISLADAPSPPSTAAGTLLDLTASVYFKANGNAVIVASLADEAGGVAEVKAELTGAVDGQRVGFGAWHSAENAASWEIHSFTMGAPAGGGVATAFTDSHRVTGYAQDSQRLSYSTSGNGFVGSEGPTGDRRHLNPILGFELPDIDPDSLVWFELTLTAVDGRQDIPAHLYGFRVSDPATYHDGSITGSEDGVDLWYQGEALDNRDPLIGGAWANVINAAARSNNILFKDCYARDGRHCFVSNGTSTVSGIVFYRSVSHRAHAASEGHRRWSQGLLFDNIQFTDPQTDRVLGLYNRGRRGTSHGWAAVHSVAWNCDAGSGYIIVQRPPTGQNYGIGNRPRVTGSGPFSHPAGFIEGTGERPRPESLYAAQLKERLEHGVAPDAPFHLEAKPREENRVDLSWKHHSANPEITFAIERASGENDWKEIARVASPKTSWRNAVSPDGDYRFRVRALREETASGFSNEARVRGGLALSTSPAPAIHGAEGDAPTEKEMYVQDRL